MWYWRTPKLRSRIYFSTARATLKNLEESAAATRYDGENFRYFANHFKHAILVGIPDGPFSANGILKVQITWEAGEPRPNLPLFVGDQRDRQDFSVVFPSSMSEGQNPGPVKFPMTARKPQCL